MAPKLMATMRSTTASKRVHDVLDPDDGDAAGVEVPDGLDEAVDLALGEAAGDLVQQQHLGVAGERASQLQALAVQQRQRPGRLVGLGGEPGQLERLDAALVARALGHAPPVGGAHEHVLEDAHVGERLGDLVRAPHAGAADVLPRGVGDVLAEELDPTPVGPIHAGDQVEERGLAGAVRPDDAQRFAFVQLHAQVVDDLHAAERFLETGGLEHHGHEGSPPCITTSSETRDW